MPAPGCPRQRCPRLIARASLPHLRPQTLTISNFPYYDFEDRDLAYTVGSAFYGLYFVVSFPVYFALDEPGKVVGPWYRSATPLRDAVTSSLASGMLVLLLLDLTRLAAVGVPLHIGGKLFEITAATSVAK